MKNTPIDIKSIGVLFVIGRVVLSALLCKLCHTLCHNELVVESLLVEKLCVSSELNYLASVENKKLVGVTESRKSVCDSKGRSADRKIIESILNELFCFCVESGCCLVENKYLLLSIISRLRST